MHLIAITMAPAIALIWFFYVRNATEQHGKWVITLLFIAGGAITMLALLMNHSLEKYTLLWAGTTLTHQRLIFWLFGIGLNEEFSKMVVLLAFFYPRRDFITPYQGLLGAATVALGFAAVENLFYLERYGTVTLLTRSVLTVPAHAFFTIPMGVLMAHAKRSEGVVGKYLWLLLGLGVSSVFHGFYDIWLSFGSGWINALAYLQVVLMGMLVLRLMKIKPFPVREELA